MENRERIIRDLIQDEYFHKFLIDPDKECEDFWIRWENEAFERRNFIGEAKRIILSAEFETHSLSKYKKDIMWDKISHRIEKKTTNFSKARRYFTKNLVYGIAASISLVLIAIFSLKSNLKRSVITENAEVKMIEKDAPKGKISTIKFEDGTVVKLFAGTRITYPAQFDKYRREVYVDGEAFFEIARDKNRPFIVKTKSLVTTAIGTSFNVRTYENVSACNISLVTGKVKVEKINKSIETLNEIILEPGEEALLVNDDVVKKAFNIQEKVSWKDGYICLEDKSFEESIQILERWFHVQFVVNNISKAKGKKGTGNFKNQNLDNILDVMGYSFDFTFEFSDNKVFVNFNS